MRGVVDRQKVEQVMTAFARAASGPLRVFLVGGTSAVVLGWRASTVDVDFAMRPNDDALLRAIPELKERLQLNLELASPADFIPLPMGWEERGTFIKRIERVDFHHFDFYAQALAKIERGHVQDLQDVREMIDRNLVVPARAVEYFGAIEPNLYRFPAIHAPAFRRAVEEAFG